MNNVLLLRILTTGDSRIKVRCAHAILFDHRKGVRRGNQNYKISFLFSRSQIKKKQKQNNDPLELLRNAVYIDNTILDRITCVCA